MNSLPHGVDILSQRLRRLDQLQPQAWAGSRRGNAPGIKRQAFRKLIVRIERHAGLQRITAVNLDDIRPQMSVRLHYLIGDVEHIFAGDA